MSNFTSLLAKLPIGLNKVADIESPDEVQMEQDFARLAYTFFKDRAPGLVPYLLGFEVVEREEDGSRAVGMFGCKVGEDYYYVPAFFVNNQIKGMDLLYSKKSNSFVPLRESWINHIVNRQTIRLGGSTNEPEPLLRRQFERPRFDFLAVPPTFPTGIPKTSEAKKADDEKGGSKNVPQSAVVDFLKTNPNPPDTALHAWAEKNGYHVPTVEAIMYSLATKCTKAAEAIQSGFDVWNAMQQAMVDAIEKDAEFQQAWAGAISRMENAPLPFEKTAEGSRLVDWLEKKGGPRAVNALLRTITENVDFAKAAFTFYPNVESLFVTKFAAELAPVKQAAKVTVVSEKTDYLDGKETKRLVRDGFTIHDERDEAEKSETYDVDYVKRFHSPDKPGLYNVLLRSGGVVQAWVFNPSGAAHNKSMVVVDTDAKSHFLAEPGAVFVRGDEVIEGPNPYDKATDLKNIEIGKKYILLNQHGDASAPFTVRSTVAESSKRTMLHVSWHTYPEYKRPTYGHDFDTLRTHSNLSTCCSPCENRDYLQLADYNGRNLSQSGRDVLIVPKNWKALELNQADKGETYEANSVMEEMFQPGTLTDVMDALAKNAFHKLAVEMDGPEYHIRFDDSFVDGKPMNYKTAMVRLVTKFGLSVDDAETMLKEANGAYKSKRMVKLGQFVGVNMPVEPPTFTGQDEFTGATVQPYQTYYNRGMMTGVVPPQNTLRPGFNLGGEAAMDLQASGLAQQAAQTGQKQIFDHSAIGGLSKIYDSGAVVDSYLPELIKSLDRLGRILFLFYWKNDEFADRYGSEDLAEMEDMIRGVFKSFGDLVLKLREKTIDAETPENTVI